MANSNDKIILELKRKVEVKRFKLEGMSGERYKAITPCIFEHEGEKINFNVASKDKLTFLLVKLNVLVMSADDLLLDDFLEGVKIQGFTLQEWMDDIKGKIKEKELKSEQEKLKEMEKQLDKLLSEDKKVELQLQEFAKFLD